MPNDPMDHSDNEGPAAFNYDDVAEGNIRIDISHAGGEMGDLQDELNAELNGKRCVLFSPALLKFPIPVCILTKHRTGNAMTPELAGMSHSDAYWVSVVK